MQNLLWFNKEGDNLNFRYSDSLQRWEGDLIFHENSNDVFKTIGLYLFEKIESFEYEVPGFLELDKFQLFNEFGFNISGSIYMTQSVEMIELPNIDPTFYSKWIIGEDFESKYPIGSHIVFNDPLFEFTNVNQSYCVVQCRKNAIMVISNLNNQSFDISYGSLLGLTSSYVDKTISGVNSIGVYNYVNQSLNNNISSWSEPDFYQKYFNDRKLTLLNTDYNDGIYTINNINLFDKVYYKYEFNASTFTQSQDLLIEIVTKTDLPSIYSGDLYLDGYRVTFSSEIPQILKPGVEFSVPSSVINTNYLVVDQIPTFVGNANLLYYATQSQVIWDNKIYECIQSYTWSGTSSITPDNQVYWSPPTYLPVVDPLYSESLYSSDIHLTTNKLYYLMPFTYSNQVMLSSSVEKWSNDFKYFNIDLYYKNNAINADLIYPSLYVEVNFYPYSVGTVSYGSKITIYENNVGILETMKNETNKNFNKINNYNIVFTDLDEFGLKININGHDYQEEIDWVYVGLSVDMERTIDRTLRSWLVKWYVRLVSIGVVPTLQYVGNYVSIYYNSINLKTDYPNVPFQFSIDVGTTADYYIPHSDVIFSDMSNYLLFNINGREYGQTVSVVSGIPDMNNAIFNWIDTYEDTLSDYGIYVSQINSMISFRIKEQFQNLNYFIKTGKSSTPGINQFIIVDKIEGNFGSVITSNEVRLPQGVTWSFEDQPFATGQIISVNNTPRPYDNQEYNILYLGSNDIVLSYQGPFWGTSDNNCSVSPFAIIAFNGGFGATGCLPPIEPVIIQYGGEFALSFTASFSLAHSSTNTYSTNIFNLNNSNICDLIHLQLNSCIYILGDNLSVMDAISTNIITTISFTSFTNAICIVFNPINNYLYCLSPNKLIIVDPLLNIIISTIVLTNSNNCSVNTINGDFYVTYSSSNKVDIWSYLNYDASPSYTITTSGNTFELMFNGAESDMYITQDNDILLRVDGSTRTIQSSYSVPGLTHSLFYDPINSAVYFFDSSGLLILNNGVTQSVGSITTKIFNEILFNNIVGQMVVSQTNEYNRLDLDGNLIDNITTIYSGVLSISQYDGDIYMASRSSSQVLVFDTIFGNIKHTETFSSEIKKMIYNPDRMTMFGIEPLQNDVIEIGVIINSTLTINNPTYSTAFESYYGTLSPGYIPHEDIWLKTREYIRKPRINYEGDTQTSYVFKWESDDVPQMFLYDFSGDQLPTSGSYSYIGNKPLDVITLNTVPNKNLNNIALPEFQQTIFDEIVKPIDYIDSSTNLSIVPEPLEIFCGFKGDDEGRLVSNLMVYKRENISFTISTTSNNLDIIQFKYISDDDNGDYGIIMMNSSSTSVFTYDENINRGLKPDQWIQIHVVDITNSKNKYISFNNGKVFRIRSVYTRYIVVDFIDFDFGLIVNEFTQIDDYPKVNKTTYLKTTFSVVDKEIAKITLYGQTEIEDVRYKTELSNVGQNITGEDISIFKSYDINEQGIDWGFLNRKRKEMMIVRHDIFPYVGSYKAIINAINYFGYNDLHLYEYYRNININSSDFFKLFKVEIPDIFDNTVEGWTPNDFIKHTMPNPNFEDTNLFNLTYFITDKEGNNVLMYSLQEVILKLQGLKYWLQRNVIPITHRILDITGRADFVSVDTIVHRSYDAKILNVNQSMTPIDFRLNEAYLMPVNSGSSVYTCHIDFYNSYIVDTPLPDYFDVRIRTYKTYKEWNPFTTYDIGDRVVYYGVLYESVIDNNRIKNPRKFEGVGSWDIRIDYTLGQFVSYSKNIYEYIGTQSSFTSYGTSSNLISPAKDIYDNQSFAKWVDVTDWKMLDFTPVQTISEYRTATHSLNFTVDSNIDPFVVIEVTSDNGYGQIYMSRKNYEVRGLSDISDPLRYIENIGPFIPISINKNTGP